MYTHPSHSLGKHFCYELLSVMFVVVVVAAVVVVLCAD